MGILMVSTRTFDPTYLPEGLEKLLGLFKERLDRGYRRSNTDLLSEGEHQERFFRRTAELGRSPGEHHVLSRRPL